MPADNVRVFLDELPWDLRSRNTDWRYVRYILPQLAAFEPTLDLVLQRSRAVTIRGNLKTIAAAVGRRIGLPPGEYRSVTSHLDRRDLDRSGSDIVFAHRAFPLNAGSTPVLWQNAILDPDMQLNYGASDDDLQREIAVKGPLFARAAAVLVSSTAEAHRHTQLFPALAERFVAIPFFTPHVHPCEPAALKRQLETDPVRILFVGNHALRKGLDMLLTAFLQLPAAVQSKAQLTVVSNFDRSAMSLPPHPRILYIRGMTSPQVIAEMQRSHILVNVARFESYGLVFVEAMAQGMVCLGPAWEVQREFFAGGAGLHVPGEARAIAAQLQDLITNPAKRFGIAHLAWERFQSQYSPASVAKRYHDLFRRIALKQARSRSTHF